MLPYFTLVKESQKVKSKKVLARASRRGCAAVALYPEQLGLDQIITCDSPHHSSPFAAINTLVIMSTTEHDPFDSLLSLEDNFYKEGYDLGIADGNRAGLIEGRLFGLEKGFEKYASMGKLYGRAVIWTGRLPIPRDSNLSDRQDTSATDTDDTFESVSAQESIGGSVQPVGNLSGQKKIRRLPVNMRLERHIRTLYALAEPESLSTDNDESAVSDFDDRFNRAEGKIKVIEKLTGETSSAGTPENSLYNQSGLEPNDGNVKKGDGGIEDISSLRARH